MPRKIFSEVNIEAAFRSIETAENKVKTIIQIRKETPEILKAPKRQIKAAPRVTFYSEKVYIIIGGTTDFGLALTDWMIKKGAKKIVLHSLRYLLTGHQLFTLKRWSEYKNVLVEVNNDTVTDLEGVQNLLEKATILGPVGGKYCTMTILVWKYGN